MWRGKLTVELLGSRYAPITDSIGFAEADFARVIAADDSWKAPLGGYAGSSIKETCTACSTRCSG
jgi:hypothetical protein